MILRLSLIFLLFSQLCFGQKPKFKAFKESKVQIINVTVDKDPNKLPLLTFTILNKTKQNIIFNKIGLILKEFKKNPSSSSTNNDLKSKVLTPIAGFDLSIPNMENSYIYSLQSPIEIVAKDAATVQIRVNYYLDNKYIVPSQVGLFKFNILFLSYDFKEIQSNDITLGSN